MYYILYKYDDLYYKYIYFNDIYECYLFITYVIDNKIDIWFTLSVDLSEISDRTSLYSLFTYNYGKLCEIWVKII
jgi:hypothetical protein